MPNRQLADERISSFKLKLPTPELERALNIKDILERRAYLKKLLLILVLLGTSMIIGDGILTPAISGTWKSHFLIASYQVIKFWFYLKVILVFILLHRNEASCFQSCLLWAVCRVGYLDLAQVRKPQFTYQCNSVVIESLVTPCGLLKTFFCSIFQIIISYNRLLVLPLVISNSHKRVSILIFSLHFQMLLLLHL